MNKEAWTRGLWRQGFVVDSGNDKWLQVICRGLYTHLPDVMPRGWHGQNVATIVEWWDKNLLSVYDSKKRLINQKHADSSKVYDSILTPYNFLAKLALPQISDFSKGMAKTQTEWDLLHVVCALQRYRQQRGNFPENLDALVSSGFIQSLPHDYVSGKPPVYERLGQTFTLASLDWDGIGLADDLVGQAAGESL